MERTFYVLLGLTACFVALTMFAFGFPAIKYRNTRLKWLKEFYLRISIALAFLTLASCSRTQDTENTNQTTTPAGTAEQTSQTASNELKTVGTSATPLVKETNLINKNAEFKAEGPPPLRPPPPACYAPTPPPRLNTGIHLRDLEEQYALLEKIFAEKKISQESYDKTKSAIKKDLETLTGMPGLTEDEKDKAADFLIQLCK